LKIEKFRAWRLREGNSKTTCNRYLQLLKKMFNVAKEEGDAEENPVQKVKLYSEKDVLREKVLTEEEEGRLLGTSVEHLRSILILALNTGMRRGEIFNLMWSQVDFRDRKIRVERTKSQKFRFIPMNSTVFYELRRLESKNGQSSYVSFNPETGKPYVDVMTAFKAACSRAGVKGLRFHDLRHTFASRLVKRGADIVTVQNLLGHSTLALTQRYTHADDERKKAAVELLSREAEERICDVSVTQENQSTLVN
jgi:integrase